MVLTALYVLLRTKLSKLGLRIKLWQIWCTVAVSNRTKLLAFYPFETQEEEKEETKWEGTEIHYSYYRHTENFILPNSQAVPARPSGTIRLKAR